MNAILDRIFIKRKLLLKYLTFSFALIFLVGMVNPGGNDDYPDTYNDIVNEYDGFNEMTPAVFIGFTQSLLANIENIDVNANASLLWAQHQTSLTRSNFNRAQLIYDRIDGISASFQTYVQNIRVRDIPGRRDLNDQERQIIDAADNARDIANNALEVYKSACRALRTAHHIAPDGIELPDRVRRHTLPDGITSIPNEVNQIHVIHVQFLDLIQDIDFNVEQNVQNIIGQYNNVLERTRLVSNSASFSAKYPISSFNDVLILGELMRNIRQVFNDIQDLIPEDAEFELHIDNIDYPVLPEDLLDRITWN